MVEERANELEDKSLKQEAFIAANGLLMSEKQQRHLETEKSKALERINYFPFTHGDMIEKQRQALQELQKHEQLNDLKERQQAAEERKRLQAQLNREANEALVAQYTQKESPRAKQTLNTSGTRATSDPRASGLLKN